LSQLAGHGPWLLGCHLQTWTQTLTLTPAPALTPALTPAVTQLVTQAQVTGVSGTEVYCTANNDATLGGLLTVFHTERSSDSLTNVQNSLPVTRSPPASLLPHANLSAF